MSSAVTRSSTSVVYGIRRCLVSTTLIKRVLLSRMRLHLGIQYQPLDSTSRSVKMPTEQEQNYSSSGQVHSAPVLLSIMLPTYRARSHTETVLYIQSIQLLHGNATESSSHHQRLRGRGLIPCSMHNQPLQPTVDHMTSIHVNSHLLNQRTSNSISSPRMHRSSTNLVR
jgi:hypothetical protein